MGQYIIILIYLLIQTVSNLEYHYIDIFIGQTVSNLEYSNFGVFSLGIMKWPRYEFLMYEKAPIIV